MQTIQTCDEARLAIEGILYPDPPLDKRQGIALVTDGSAYYKDGSAGWAFIALDAFEGVFKAASYRGRSTNNQMELVAPTKGLEWAAAQLGPCEVLVYSDSEYVVKGAMDRTRSRTKNKSYWRDLDAAMTKHPYVEFLHVKGHSGHVWNEMADQMAGEARKKGAK